MRVSTSQIYNIATLGMRQAQAEVVKTEEQIATGKRVLSPADDPVAAANILLLNQNIARTEQYKKNVDIADNSLSLEETNLQSIVELMQRMRELGVKAGNTAVLTAADYQSLAAEVDTRISELINLQNTRNSSGQYIFAGYKGDTQPFVSNGGGNYTYMGDEGQLNLQASGSVSVAVSDSGKKLFVDIPSSHNTFITSASSANRAAPAAVISVGQVTDQEVFDAFYPEDMVITFNAPSAVADPSAIPPQPAAANYTITERTTGKVLVANALYTKGEEIEINGVSLNITGNPSPPTSATLPFNFATPVSIPAGTSFKVTVNGRTETFTFNAAVNNQTDFVTALSAAPNTGKLGNLGLTASTSGFASASGANISVHSGTTALDSAIGLAVSTGVTSTNGVAGDSFFVESTNKQGLLTTLSRFSDAMKNVKDTTESKAELAEMVAKTIVNLTNAETTIVSVQGEIGARQNTLESARDLNLDVILYSQQTLSSLEDVDVAEATIRLSMQSLVLQASQQGFAKVSQLTLFSYL
ncbi:flagellar hook-associated protein FlgL [Cellvibrio sp. NN19]|uniref:flagellar hook-associated protein FlgL n=1 Tax=Cellvibrio chitinivorans TaxID=3102792 RepID=UPI002B405DCD|nr:flagellar hook-associated protein FlgL [Cellvibrio sp. NN19]